MGLRHVRSGGWQLICFCALLAGGCPVAPDDGNGNGGNDDEPQFPFLDQDGNFTFDSATALSLSSTQNELHFSGAISGDGDIDIYSLGTLSAGDALFVDVVSVSGNLDSVAAVFDSREFIHLYNDDRSPSDLNPRIDDVIRGPQGEYYLGIAPFFGDSTSGDYHVTVRIARAAGVPSPQPQTVYFDWRGGAGIHVPNVGTFDLPPFDAGQLGPFEGRTPEMKRRIIQVVSARFAGFNITLLSSDDGPPPETPHSTLYFGGSNAQAFAISEQIDTLNHDPADESIIFTQSFAEAFTPSPSFDEMATAIANTVAHEIGHLLGLVHTADPDELMDTTGRNERLLLPQAFGTARLDRTVFTTGFQNAPELIAWAVGLTGI